MAQYPLGLATKTITFGRYSNALGNNVGGKVIVGFENPILHVPSGEVILAVDDFASIDPGSGIAQVTVPITVTPDLVTAWDSASPYNNQRLKITVDLPGYPKGARFLDIHPDDPMVMDYDQLQPYSVPGGLTVSRAAVISVAGETGEVSATELSTALNAGRLPGQGIRLVSPNGTAFMLTVSDAGTLVVAAI